MLRTILCNRWNVLLLAAALAPLVLQADVVFTNVNSSDVSDGSAVCGGSSNGCPNQQTGISDAEAFTPTADFTLTDAQMLVYEVPGSGDPDFNVFLDSNASGTPGSVIEQIGFGLAATAAFPNSSFVTANSIATPITLTSGTEYWLVLRPADSDSYVGWSNGGSPSVPFASTSADGTVWITATSTDQFQIDGTPITTTPEPSTLPLASVAVLSLLIAARRAVRAR